MGKNGVKHVGKQEHVSLESSEDNPYERLTGLLL